MRITYDFVNVESDPDMTTAKVNFLRNTLIPAAVARIQELLQVERVSGNLFAARPCTQAWSNGKCHSISSTATYAIGSQTFAIPDAYIGQSETYASDSDTSPTVHPALGPGIPNSDFHMFVYAQQQASCGGASGGTTAFALTCQRDQLDRPIIGVGNWCPQRLEPSGNLREQVYVAIHEFFHALGFSSSSFPLFRDESGSPRTPRSAAFPSQPADAYLKEFSCGGGTVQRYMPGTNTVGFFAERGMAQCTSEADMAVSGKCVARVVTSRAVTAARAHFNCSTLPGPELENQRTSPCTLLGSHWEQRMFNSELMAPYSSHHPMISAVTLAVFEDMGVYKANYSAADRWRKGIDWGYQQGCSFATSKCLSGGQSIGVPAHFCTDNSVLCTADQRGYGACNADTGSSGLPAWFQYFTDATKGGYNPVQTDFCPVVTPYSDRVCSSPTSMHGNEGADFGWTPHVDALCMTASLHRATGSAPPAGLGCFRIECEDRTAGAETARVYVDSGESKLCTAPGEMLSFSAYVGTVTCPAPAVICGSPAPLNLSDFSGPQSGTGSDPSNGGTNSTTGGDDSGGDSGSTASSALEFLKDYGAYIGAAVGAFCLVMALKAMCCKNKQAVADQQVEMVYHENRVGPHIRR